MEGVSLASFLVEEEKQAEQRLRSLNRLLTDQQELVGGGSAFPCQVVETLHLLRQNAEEDLSNILHIQSIFPSSRRAEVARKGLKLTANLLPSKNSSPVKAALGLKNVFTENGAVLGQVDEGVEAAVAVTDDLFLMEGVDECNRSPGSLLYSEEEHEDSELDEGIHIPSKRRERASSIGQVAASLPVGIPWAAQITSLADKEAPDSRTRTVETILQRKEEKPRDIAASIQAMAKSVHTSSMFGDNVFGDLPRPRLNTASKE